MSATFRRFEILLPLRFNDGNPVPDELVADALLAMRARFGAVSAETQTIRGWWMQGDEEFRDDLIRVFVDVPDVPENREFFTDFKTRLMHDFRQLDIWMTTYLVEAI